MKKVFVIAGVIGAMSLAACNGNPSNNTSDAGQTIDSMVDQATSAVKNTADSATQAVQNAADSTKAIIDSTVNSNK